MPLASVLLPVYNGEKHIGEAVQSVLNQTWQDFDLYVIDDGSTDKTVSILQEFTDERLHIVKNEENRKLIYTLNRGLQIAIDGGYKYIIRMDADDICVPERFEKQIAFMEAHTDVGLCGSWVKEFNAEGPIKISRRNRANEKIASELFFQNTIWHPSVVIRTEVIKQHHLYYEEKFLHAEDYALWYRMSLVTKLANLQEVLLDYRVHTTNVSVLNNEQQRQTCVDINAICLQHLLSQWKHPSREQKEEIVNRYTSLLNTIPFEAEKITKEDMDVFKQLIQINSEVEMYNESDFKSSLAEFILQYWSLWCKKYTLYMFTLLFVHGRWYSKYWPVKRQLVTVAKCVGGWRSRA